MKKNYNLGVQKLLVSQLLYDEDSFARCKSIVKPEYFDGQLRPAIRLMLEYSEKYRSLPTPDQMRALANVEVDPPEGQSVQRMDWFLDTMEGFCRYKALEIAILEAHEMLESKQEGGDIETKIKDAMTISLLSDLGTDYFADPKARLEQARDKSNFISTGWKTLDAKLNGGFTRGALNVFCGGSGSGKSLVLQNLAVNWALAGMKVVYISLELAEELVSMRLDSMLTGISSKEILTSIDSVAHGVIEQGKRANGGSIHIKKLPESGTTANTIRAYLKEYEIRFGHRPDAVLIDYLDLMAPNSDRVDLGNAFMKDKYTSEEMRAMAGDYRILCATASQLNRSSVDTAEFDHSHIAGGISKINTADNVIAIFVTAQMKEKGLYEFQFLKTRSAASVGQKCQMKYGVHSLRIEDQAGGGAPTGKAALTMKTGTTPNLQNVKVPDGQSIRSSILDKMRNPTK